MGIRRGRLLAAVLSLIGFALPQAAGATTLEESVAQALATRPDLKERQALTEAAEAAVEVALAPYRPTLDLSVFAGGRWEQELRFQGEAALRGRQYIFDGFGTEAGVEAAEARLAAARGQVAESVAFVALEAARAHLDVLRSEALARIAADNLEALRRLYGQVRQLGSGGRLTEADVAQAKTRVALAEADLAERLGALAVAVARYVAVVGAAPETLTEPTLPLDLRPASEAEAVAAALQSHPSLIAARAEVSERQADIKSAESAFYPEVDALAEATVDRNVRDLDNERAGIFLGGEANWNLYNGGGDTARVAGAEAGAAAAGYALQEQQRIVSEEAMVAYRRLLAAEAQYAPLNDAEAAARRLYGAYAQQFEAGTRPLLDLLDAEDERTTAALRGADLRQRLVLAHYELLYATGRLPAALGVAAPGPS
jgi:adhesin transport system outer membrane protein